jgi:hypothetical protein
MSDASVITDVSETLRSILDAHLNPTGANPGDSPGVGAPVTVTVDNPQRSAGEDLRVNLYLYHILQDESRRNTGPLKQTARETTPATFVPEPLPLKLYYMVTAFAPDGRTEHRLIGEAMQALFENRILPIAALRGDLAKSAIKADQIQLVQLNQDLETLHRIWGNFQEALRPSITYEVEGVFLDSRTVLKNIEIVKDRFVEAVPIPFLTEVTPAVVRPGDTVRLRGANLDLRSPRGENSLVHILLGGKRIEPIADRRTNTAVSIVIPADTRVDGKVQTYTLQVRIGDFVSSAVALEVLAK